MTRASQPCDTKLNRHRVGDPYILFIPLGSRASTFLEDRQNNTCTTCTYTVMQYAHRLRIAVRSTYPLQILLCTWKSRAMHAQESTSPSNIHANRLLASTDSQSSAASETSRRSFRLPSVPVLRPAGHACTREYSVFSRIMFTTILSHQSVNLARNCGVGPPPPTESRKR